MTAYYEWHECMSLAERQQLIQSGGNEPDPPAELLILWNVEDYNRLPLEGGVLDQPDFLMQCLAACRNARGDVMIVKRDQKRAEEERNHAS